MLKVTEEQELNTNVPGKLFFMLAWMFVVVAETCLSLLGKDDTTSLHFSGLTDGSCKGREGRVDTVWGLSSILGTFLFIISDSTSLCSLVVLL